MFILNLLFAEKAGFEPAIRFWRIHAFQACLFNHSSISPHCVSTENTCKLRRNIIFPLFPATNILFLLEISCVIIQKNTQYFDESITACKSNTLKAFFFRAFATFSGLISKTEAIFPIISFRNEGSFRFPRQGKGAR